MAANTQTCPECAEEVKAAARVCRFCGHRFAPPLDAGSAPPAEASERDPGRPVTTSAPMGGELGEGEDQPRGPHFVRRRWRGLLLGLAGVLVLAGIGVAVALNWEPESVFEDVTAPRYDSGLAAGGLSSAQIGTEAVLSSLENTDQIGYEILADAADEGVVDDFAEVPASGQWDAVYQLNGTDHVFRFDATDNEFVLVTKPYASRTPEDELFAIGRRYGYYSSEVRQEERALDERTNALLETVAARQFYLGESEPDIAAEAATLADEWNRWLEDYGESPPKARVVELQIQILNEVETVATSDRGFGRYKDLIDEYNVAVDAYNQAID